jgi:hypothetical protein
VTSHRSATGSRLGGRPLEQRVGVAGLIDTTPAGEVEASKLGRVQACRFEAAIFDPRPVQLDDLVVIAVATLDERVPPLRRPRHGS